MKKIPTIATLSDRGYIDSAEGVLSTVLSYYFLTDGDQSLLNRSSIISLPKTYYMYINSPEEFRDKVKSEVDVLLSNYFETYEVVVDVVYPNEEDGKADITVYATVVDENGKKVGLGKVTRLTETGLTNVININNYGDRHRYVGG